jgi:eukaryotic-like serine/threonine-protein kinase
VVGFFPKVMPSLRPEPTGAVRVGTWLRDKYHLDRVLGEGGMATVYAATHRNKKRFAVKMLLPQFSLHMDIRARFLREGYLANTVDHPGAVAVLDDDVAEDGSAFLVMELLEGVTVESLCDDPGRRIDTPAVLSLAYQLLDVLAAAHAKGVVHRDIKPANLFVTRSGIVKVLDFGIARLREGDELSTTRTGVHMGTPAFMSPEQAGGRMSQIDARSDLWSVGATLFYLLTKRNVHSGETAQHVMMLTATTQADTIVSVEPGIPAELGRIIDRALALNKKDRWPDASAMRDAVGAAFLALAGVPVSPAPLTENARGSGWSSEQVSQRLGDQPTVRSAPGLAASLPTVPATPFVTPPHAGAAAAIEGGVEARVTAYAPIAKEVASATMAPVSSSPSPQGRRGRRIAIVGALAATLAAGGVYLGVSMRASSTRASGAASAESYASPPQAAAPSEPNPPSPSPLAPAAPPTGVPDPDPLATSPAAAADASTGSGSRSPSGPHHGAPRPGGAKPPSAAPSPTTPGTDFDRQ